MKNLMRKSQSKDNQKKSGFTLVELLVVIAVISLLAAMLLPVIARAKDKAYSAQCASQLKQVGVALQIYVDDNQQYLPGPVWAGARASYDNNSKDEFIWHIATHLGSPTPSGQIKIAQAFICPAYWRKAPGLTSDPMSLAGRKVYLLNDDIDPNPLNRVSPFGYVNPAVKPVKYNNIDIYIPRSQILALSDVDQSLPSLNPSVSWWSDLPNKPVHGPVRNQLFFDWHVQAVKW